MTKPLATSHLLLALALVMLFSCSEHERDNPLDPKAVNYSKPSEELSSSGVELSSSSGDSSSSSEALSSSGIELSSSSGDSSSSSEALSSSSVAQSSSSETPSSSGTGDSSSSVEDNSSSSNYVSSSSEVLSSSSVELSSSSETPSSSSSDDVSSSSSEESSSSVCTAYDNTSTQYCSNGTMKTYGSVTHGEQTYKTIVIGSQTWMAENLNYNATNSRCYEEQESNCDIYGRLYDWATAMALPSKCNNTLPTSDADCAIGTPHQGICPFGWHISSENDWNTLILVGSYSTAGKNLKATSWWNDHNDIVNLDTYGFSALPGGVGSSEIGERGYWWTPIVRGINSAYSLSMRYNSNEVYVEDYYSSNNKSESYSVRCVKDAD